METKKPQYPKSVQVAIIVGAGLILFGILKLVETFFGASWFTALRDAFSTFFSLIWPVGLILAGIYLVWVAKQGKLKGVSLDPSRPFRRSTFDKRIAGVCGGIAQFLGIDSTIIRVLAVILLVISPIFTLIVYFIAAIFMPRS